MDGQGLEPDDPGERAREDERHRLALYLHDSVGQALCFVKLQLARIQQDLRVPLDSAKHAWLQRTVDALIPEMDTVIQAIQAEALRLSVTARMEVGLTVALQRECAAFMRRTGILCDGRFECVDLDASRGAVVVLIVREALANIARHAHATTAEVTLQRTGDQGILSVRDNGSGIDPIRMGATESLGIRAMKQRARTLGGELLIDSTPNAGTRIRVSFPVAPGLKNTFPPD